jgi:hypothetical protein
MKEKTIEGFSKCSGGCLAKDTRITMADNTSKIISDIYIGDQVMSSKNEALRVHNVYVGENDAIISITTEVGCLSLSFAHPLMTREGLKPAENISESDQLLSERGDYVKVLAIRMEEYKDNVYNLELHSSEAEGPEQHTMIANGIVVGDVE